MDKKNNKTLIWSAAAIVVIAIVVVIVVLVNNKSNNNSLSSAQKNSDSQQIESNWKAFFAASTSQKDRQNLLQNGSAFSQPLSNEFAAFGAERSYADVSNVTVNSPTSASVTYTVYLENEPALSNKLGNAVFVNKTWKVSDATFCGLLSMAGEKLAICKSY